MFKASGNPISVLREHLQVNVSSIGGVGSNPAAQCDFFPELSRIDGEPTRLAKTHDATDYSSNPVEDSWEMRLAGGCGSGANAARLNSSTNIRGGQMT
jgi:hypothetical protein